MTALLGPGERPAHVLWLSSFILIFVLHAGLLAAVLTRGPELEEGIPSEAITVDLSPEPSTASPQPEAAPGPPLPEPATPSAEQVAEGEPEAPAPDAPPSTVAEALPEPKVSLPPEPPPAVEPAVTLPDPPPQPEPPKEVEPEAAKPEVSAPSAARPEAAPVESGGGRPSAARVATWKSALALRLAKAKRYPAEAHVRGQSGVATVRVRLDRSGRVIAKALVKSSGVDALDRESLALIERAQPLPAPPVGMAAPLELTVPVQFSLR